MKKKKTTNALMSLSPQTIATSLRIAETDLESIELLVKNLREKLFNELKSQGVKAVRLENGDQYIRAERMKLVVKNEKKAIEWALENPEARMKLDNSAALLSARQGSDFFEVGRTEYLTIRRARPTPTETNQEVDGGE